MGTSHPAGGPGGASAFSAYRIGQVVGAVSARLDAKVTTPPERYTQDTLLDDMVNAHKFGRNDTERQMLKATEGLGTSRTRVPMIMSLIRRNLLETAKVGKRWQIRTTAPAREMLPLVPDDLKNVAMTARWEMALAGVRSGKFKASEVLAGGYKFVEALVEDAKNRKAQRLAAGQAGARGPHI